MKDELIPNPIAITPVVENDTSLQKWADSERCALLAFIAPYVGKRVSPVSEVFATIGMQEEFGIESFIDQCAAARIKKLHMLVNSPGGGVVSSYKIAKALRSQFTEIRVFVPHMAASGGTLIALTGDEIVMGVMSHLSPLDPQFYYQGMSISSNTFARCFERFQRSFAQLQPDEAPYPIRCMTEKLDPLVMEEMNGTTQACIEYVIDILRGAGYPAQEAIKKALYLTMNFTDHSTVLRKAALKEQGFKVVDDSKYRKEWLAMRQWLRKYIASPEGVHHLRYCLPRAASAKTPEAPTNGRNGSKMSVEEKPGRRPTKKPGRRPERRLNPSTDKRTDRNGKNGGRGGA
jgi:hypothetical protein